jgi:hypothetical protein
MIKNSTLYRPNWRQRTGIGILFIYTVLGMNLSRDLILVFRIIKKGWFLTNHPFLFMNHRLWIPGHELLPKEAGVANSVSIDVFILLLIKT